MPVIALVGNKGGAGKTTLSVNLAAGLARQGKSAMLDADPQGSSLQWRAFADDDKAPDVFQAIEDLGTQTRELSSAYQYVIVDCPPSVHAPQTNAVLQVCDLAIIPVQPSPMDLWATVHIERAISQARENNPALLAVLVINQLESRTTLSKIVREALAEIALPVAVTSIRRRAIYRTSILEGKSIFDVGKRGQDAANELDQLINEVIPS